ncbi:MAG: extracellular solute-binding protein [Clostridiales bacterium]|nr:extracellular solute-binding protein [Clostridiales bacterium]
MSKINKIFVLLIILTLLFGCSDKSEAHTETTVTETVETTTEAETTPLDTLKGLDFDGASFRVKYNKLFEADVYRESFLLNAEEINGEILNDTVFERNTKAEELLNINLEFSPYGSVKDLNKSIMAGANEFEMIQFGSAWDNAVPLISEGALYNILDLPYMQLNKSYFYGDITERFIINDRLYFAFSQYNNAGSLPLYMLFNKNLMEDMAIDLPYDNIFDGKWTWDRFLDTIKDTAADLDGNGKLDENDRFGYLNLEALTNYFVWGFDIDVTERTNDGSYIPNLHNERLVSGIQKIVDFIAYNDDILHTSNFMEGRHYFMEGRVLFSTVGTGAMQPRDVESFDFGVAPLPKYEETQKNYYCPSGLNHFAIPVTIQDTELTGATLEALAYLSEQILKPAYLEIYHENKILRDQKSAEVALLLMDSVCIDITRYYDFANGKITPVYMLLEIKDPSAVASTLASFEESAMVKAEEFFAVFFD